MLSTPISRRVLAELIGTFWLVLGGCGSAVIAAKFPEVGIGLVGVALAFGLAVLTMAYAVGSISGGHFNPAVTLGLVVGGRFRGKDMAAYVGAQLVGAILGGAVLYAIASGSATFTVANGFAANGFGDHSPGGYSMGACFLAEVVLTFGFVLVILGVTQKSAPSALAPLAIGLTLTVIHLVSIPVTNTSVNPARSTGVAIFAGGWAIAQLPFFWIAPLIGGAAGGALGRYMFSERRSEDVPVAQPRAV